MEEREEGGGKVECGMVESTPELSVLELFLAGRQVDTEVDLGSSSQDDGRQVVAVEAEENHP